MSKKLIALYENISVKKVKKRKDYSIPDFMSVVMETLDNDRDLLPCLVDLGFDTDLLDVNPKENKMKFVNLIMKSNINKFLFKYCDLSKNETLRDSLTNIKDHHKTFSRRIT